MRRHKILSSAGATLAASIILITLLTGCGDDGSPGPGCGDPCNSLVFTREDSSVIEFPASAETYAWCGDWNPEQVPVPALHVWFGTLESAEAGWRMRAVVDDIELETPLPFPITFVWDQPEGVHMFLNDPPNELATDTEDASGTITFHQLPCPDGKTVEFSIEAVLGSEYGDMPSVAVTGSFTGNLASPPWDIE